MIFKTELQELTFKLYLSYVSQALWFFVVIMGALTILVSCGYEQVVSVLTSVPSIIPSPTHPIIITNGEGIIIGFIMMFFGWVGGWLVSDYSQKLKDRIALLMP